MFGAQQTVQLQRGYRQSVNSQRGNVMLEILPKMDEGHEVTIGGYLVPRVRVTERPDTGQWNVTLDGRHGIVAEDIEELQRWLWMIANAMAIGAGYSCHGENSQPHNRYKVQVVCIGSAEVTDTPGG